MDTLTKQKLVNPYYFIFFYLYAGEVILGFNGKLGVYFGIPIRIILFILALSSVYGLLCYALYQKRVTIKKGENSLFAQFNYLDYGVFFFLLFNGIWAVVIPMIQGGSIYLGIKEIGGLVNLLFYFPLSYFIRNKIMEWKLHKNITLTYIVLLGILHGIFYLAEKSYPGFLETFFTEIIQLLGGEGGIPNVIRGHGYTRIIFPSSVLLLLGVYCTFMDLKGKIWIKLVCLFVCIFGILTTLTKSLMLGSLIAGIFTLGYILFIIKDKTLILKGMLLTLGIGVFIAGTNDIVFDNLVYQRMGSLYIVNEENIIEEGLTEIEKNEIEGSIEGNQIRIKQTKDLLEKFREKPLIGHGFGSYVEDNIRGNPGYEYLYEVFLPALLMKIGILGLGVWIGFGCCILFFLFQHIQYKKLKVPIIMSGFLGLAVVIQTNPLLFSFGGMYIVLILLLDVQQVGLKEKSNGR